MISNGGAPELSSRLGSKKMRVRKIILGLPKKDWLVYAINLVDSTDSTDSTLEK